MSIRDIIGTRTETATATGCASGTGTRTRTTRKRKATPRRVTRKRKGTGTDAKGTADAKGAKGRRRKRKGTGRGAASGTLGKAHGARLGRGKAQGTGERIAIISDIHGNSEAFRRVLVDLKARDCTRIICLGDIVGYGYAPHECVELARRHCDECVLGNHDAGLIGNLGLDWFCSTARAGVLRHRGQVTEADREFLRTLPYGIVRSYNIGGRDEATLVAYAHGGNALPEAFDYIDSQWAIKREAEAMVRDGVRVLFVGHTHEQAAASLTVDAAKATDSARFHAGLEDPANGDLLYVGDGRLHIINVGSVGYPRVEPFTCYAVFDTAAGMVERIRLPFYMARYCADLEDGGVPIPTWVDRWLPGYEETPPTGAKA